MSVVTLGVTGFVILMAHPRLYWGEAGNDLTPPLLELPISRNYQHGGWDARTPFFPNDERLISANRTYDIFNKNGWGRSLHFLAAWCLVLPGVYTCSSASSAVISARTSGRRPPNCRRVSSGATSSLICG